MKTIKGFVSWKKLSAFVAACILGLIIFSWGKNLKATFMAGWGISMLFCALTVKEWMGLKDSERPLAVMSLSTLTGTAVSIFLLPPILHGVGTGGWKIFLELAISTLTTSSIGCGLGILVKKRLFLIYASFLMLSFICAMGLAGQELPFPMKNPFLFAIFPIHGGDAKLFLISSGFWFFLVPFISSYI